MHPCRFMGLMHPCRFQADHTSLHKRKGALLLATKDTVQQELAVAREQVR